MSLETNKSISLTGKIMINGNQIGYLSATIDQQGNGNDTVNQSIQNQEVYDANKAEVRKDIQAFQQLVWDTEDKMDSETAEAETTPASTSDTSETPATDGTEAEA